MKQLKLWYWKLRAKYARDPQDAKFFNFVYEELREEYRFDRNTHI